MAPPLAVCIRHAAISDRPCVAKQLLKVLVAFEALSVNFVYILGSRGAHCDPAAARSQLDAADWLIIALRSRLHLRDLIADEHHESTSELEQRTQELGELTGDHGIIAARLAESEAVAADALEAATKRIEDIAGRLAEA